MYQPVTQIHLPPLSGIGNEYRPWAVTVLFGWEGNSECGIAPASCLALQTVNAVTQEMEMSTQHAFYGVMPFITFIFFMICRPSGCTVVSGVVISICNHFQMRTSKYTCLILV